MSSSERRPTDGSALFADGLPPGVQSVREEGGELVPPSSTRVPREGHLPLSFAQQRLWFLDQLRTGNAFYTIPRVLRLVGKLDIEVLERALQGIVARHESLRTRFESVDGLPVQVIEEDLPFRLAVVDLRGLPEEERQRDAERRAAEEVARPFDLSAAPLLRVSVLRLTEGDHLLVVTMHHIVSDGWSMGIFFQELAELYRALSSGERSPLPPLPIQYADYAVWQREWLRGGVIDEELAYWRKQLADLPVLELPTDRPRPPAQSFRGARHSMLLPNDLSEQLRKLSRRESVTLYMTLLAAFQALLLRYTGQEDVVVGSPIASRTRSEIEGLIGFFVNTLVLRTNLSGDPSFRDLLKGVRKVAGGAYSHQDLPFEKLVEELHPERDLSLNPLFQVTLVLQNAPDGELELPGITSTDLGFQTPTTRFDLEVHVFEKPGGLKCDFVYATDLFDSETIVRMMEHYRTLLEGAAADPDRRIWELPMVTEAERRKVVEEWNRTGTEYPRDRTVHELFEEQAERTPTAEAVVFGGERLSYAELNQRANRLARYLKKRAVGPDVLVGLCVERSLEMVVGLLGILKAGGAYAPLDPAYPRERLSFLLRDTAAPLVLTQERLSKVLPEGSFERVLLDADWHEIGRESGENLPGETRAENLAYVMYTSGSTGEPKGVSIRHRGVARLVRGTDYAALGPDQTFLQFASISFDASTFEIWGALLNGGRLAVMPPGIPSLEELGESLSRYGVTTLWLTAGLFHQMVETQIESLRGVRQLLAGGDALSVSDVKKVLRELPGCRLIDAYGPTESTTFATSHTLSRDEPLGATVPIGRPIANTRVFILDRNLRPAPVGVPGELYIGGDGLARDYFRRPGLTAEKFVPDPFGGDGDERRLYRSGDRARYRADGTIEFLGRVDDQIKVRGYRIEPGEIESHLAQHPSVAASVLLAREDSPGDRRLTAYVVRRDGKLDPIPGLRDFVAGRLPDYMVPSAFVFLDALPLTANGKVDRRALPAPEGDRPEGEDFVAPRTPTEKKLAEIWAAILKLERIGVHDNFFALGGHSLLATQVISRVRNYFQVEASLRTFFQCPTIAEFAEALSRQAPAADAPILQVDRGSQRFLPASFAQQRLWFVDQLEPRSPAYNMAQAARVRTRLDPLVLERSLQEITRRHEVLRTTFTTIDGEPMQVVSPERTSSLRVIDVSPLGGPERNAESMRILAEEIQTPFDLVRGPLLRLTLLRLREDDHLLLLTMHHIVSDGWSMGVFFRELTELYEAFSTAGSSPLSPLPIQYADYALWQRESMRGERLEKRLSYWKKQLSDPPILELPADRPRTTAQSFRGARHSISIPKTLTDPLKELCQREDATLFMTLLAAFQVLLARLSGQDDIVVGAPIAERNRVETEELIGYFINMLALRTDLSGDPSFRELLGRVRKVALDAFTHELPFEKLVELLQPKRDLSRTPVFQVFFNLLSFDTPEARLAGVVMEPVEVPDVASRFDLTLYASEEGDGIRFSAVYNPDLFDRARISEMLEQLVILLEQVVKDPRARIGSYTLVTASARSLLPDPAVSIPEPEMGVAADDFLSWADRTPSAAAVVADGRVWTYADLAHRSRVIAESLLARSLEPGDVVGVAGRRSFGLIAGILGVFRSGGVLLTLDPLLPAERSKLMLSEARARFVLQTGGGPDLPADLPTIGVSTDGMVDSVDRIGPVVRLPRVSGNDPGYIFFTSGTSGVPKAVLGRQKGLSHFLKWQRGTFEIGPGDRCSQLTGLSFDAVLRDIFLPLTSGASLHLPDPSEDAGSNRTVPWIERERITILHTVPSVAQSWLAAPTLDAGLSSLRWAFFAGEPLTEPLVRRWTSAFPEAGRIVNLYGPTETTLVKCFFVVPPNPPAGIQPVGGPLPNTQALLLANGQRLCGIGEIGEIVLRTPFRTLGYVNAPREHRDRFIPNPFRTDADDVLYRTGDRGRYRLDGSVAILGRLDDQVKIRGVRIEPAEVSAVLSAHPSISSCAVVAGTDDLGETTLVAYVVVPHHRPSTAAQLRNHLSKRLPAAMLPSAFVFLKELPLTPNGKLDRAALPAPEAAPKNPAPPLEAPRTPFEAAIAGIWASVLGVERIEIHEDFFELGGHSLKATRVMSRVNQTFRLDLPVRALFENPTVASLSSAIQNLLLGPTEGGGRSEAAADQPPVARPPASSPTEGSREDAPRLPALREMAPGKQGLDEPSVRPTQRRIPHRVGAEESAGLSFAQQRLWLLDRLDPGLPFYNIPRAFRLRGRLDVGALERALEGIQNRHEVLRSIFPLVDGNPVQVVSAPGRLPLSVVDYSGLSEGEQEAQVRRVTAEEAHRPFDLAAGPLVRTKLLRLSEQEHVLLITVHHIVFDGWSGEIFHRELAELYEAYSQGRPSPLPPLPIQYADFAVWQREWLRGKVFEEQLSYWKRQLEGAPAVLELPTSRPRPSRQTFRGAAETLSIPSQVAEPLRTLGQREGATLFMTLLAAFKLLLSRHSGQQDIVVGSPVAGRNRADIEGLIGFFVNTLVFRTDLSGDPTFRQLLGRVREVAIDAFAHQDLPFERLVEELNPQRTLSHSPLFQVMMTLYNAPTATLQLRLPGLFVTSLPLELSAAKFDLTASFADTGKEIEASFQYNVDLFEAPAIRRMLSHLQVLLEAIAANPDLPLSQLPLLTPQERHQLLVEWNQTDSDYPKNKTIHQLFEDQSLLTPNAVAVEDAREAIRYGDLNRRANRLAHFLRKHGVGAEDIVGVCLERSANAVAVLLGVLKAGGAYLPLDPSYPVERLRFMLRDSGARLLLTENGLAPRFHDSGTEVFCVDSLPEDLSREPETNPVTATRPDGLAYVIYTSGSTGKPKGVEALHRASVNRFAWMWRAYPFAAGEVCCQKTALSFVDSVWEIFGPLLAGIPSVVLADEAVRDPRRLVEGLAEGRVTRIVLVPSLLSALLDSDEDLARRLPLLKWWFTSGEALSLELYRRFRQALPGAALVNLYGSSEVSADVTCYDSRWEEPRDCVPIGRPIANAQVYVLDERSQPLPIGIPGELYVGGHGLARGYRNRPELTDERFVPDPFRKSPGGRLFATGDRGRYREDGQIDYLGRNDHQVKLRGHRIELGEIELALAAHPDVGGAVVVVREDAPGDPRLTAYVVAKQRHDSLAADLRGFLESRLPNFMVPSIFVFLEAFPLSPSGKIDRNALPAPNTSAREPERALVAPRSVTEERVARIWSEVLGFEQIGVHDNFFDLGGHSLLAVKLLAEIEKSFGRRLALATIFRSPTVAKMSEMLQERRQWRRRSPSLVAIQPEGTKPAFFCVHDNSGHVYYRRLARALGRDQPFYGLQAQGLDGTRPPYDTVEQMAAHYVQEIRAFQPQGPYYLGGHSFGGKVAFEMARQLGSLGQRIAVLAFFDTWNFPLDPQPTRLEFARERTRLHVQNLKKARPTQKVSYLLHRMETLLRLILRPLLRAWEAIVHPLRRAERRVLEANGRAARRYVPGFYDGRVTIFRATDRWRNYGNVRSLTDPELGWGRLCESVEVHEVPGGHASILHEDANIGALAERLSNCLRNARQRYEPGDSTLGSANVGGETVGRVPLPR